MNLRESQVTAQQWEVNFTSLACFMDERHRIYQRRASGLPGPWTGDAILRDNRFCNIFRELDRVTIWVRENIREPFAKDYYLWFMLAIARYINWPPTLEVLMKVPGAWPDSSNFDPRSMTEVLEGLAQGGDKVYTGAYMIRAESDPRTPWYNWTKHRYIAEVVLGKLWERREELKEAIAMRLTSLQAMWSVLAEDRHLTGWGPFMSYEWVTDLRHTCYGEHARDIYTWANAGPGAIRGLNRLHGRPLSVNPGPSHTCLEMMSLMSDLNRHSTSSFDEVFGQPWPYQTRFEMRDVEHVLCEFDKYQRILRGEGKMRAKYDWTKAQPLPVGKE